MNTDPSDYAPDFDDLDLFAPDSICECGNAIYDGSRICSECEQEEIHLLFGHHIRKDEDNIPMEWLA